MYLWPSLLAALLAALLGRTLAARGWACWSRAARTFVLCIETTVAAPMAKTAIAMTMPASVNRRDLFAEFFIFFRCILIKFSSLICDSWPAQRVRSASLFEQAL